MANSDRSCMACVKQGILCEMNLSCTIPTSDATMLESGIQTAGPGFRKCVRCAVAGHSCTFPQGYRPEPCFSCVCSRAFGCILPLAPAPFADLNTALDTEPRELQDLAVRWPMPSSNIPALIQSPGAIFPASEAPPGYHEYGPGTAQPLTENVLDLTEQANQGISEDLERHLDAMIAEIFGDGGKQQPPPPEAQHASQGH
ncbi:hypothetical protein GGS23DRAFT_101642 [Durotheca rogersii]|uniref:uncharacterized protein n=1 Tax=Durotheca rogersii TaxID=419775 RepID=UPI00221FCB6E|nr:uncharacterized protein GGS23DRAFT_101642 [Durotheca rogersii]KAI5862464.1 hypothetical protein GGS23DRAFT_101642 [Durotheca rogersii]